MSSRSESVRGLIPGHACSSSMNRRGPFGEVVDDQRRPLRRDHLRGRRDGAVRVVDSRSSFVSWAAVYSPARPVDAIQRIGTNNTFLSIVHPMSRSPPPRQLVEGRRAWTHELVGYALDVYHRRNLRTPTVARVAGRRARPPQPLHRPPALRQRVRDVPRARLPRCRPLRRPAGSRLLARGAATRAGCFVSRRLLRSASHESTAAAQRRPSRSPRRSATDLRRASPAAKTPSTEVA